MIIKILPPSAFLLMLMKISVAQEQQIADEALFDALAPSVLDNLPPGSSLQDFNQEPSTPEWVQPLPLLPVLSPEQEALRQALLAGAPELEELYRAHQYQSVWTEALQGQWLMLYPVLAQRHALPEARYAPEGHLPPELAFSRAYLRLAGDLANGLVDPTHTHREWNAPKLSAAHLFQTLQENQDLYGNLEALNGDNWRYQALQRYFLYLSHLPAAADDGLNLSNKGSLKPLAKHQDVLVLRAKLGVGGDSNVYDEALVEAVKQYQMNVGLQPDGIVGGQTRVLLNKKRQDVLDDLKINMERLRWLPQDLGESNVVVNIPQYEVKMFRDGAQIYRTRSVVGRKDRQTPAFVDRLRHVVMSPTWTVPPTIMKKDKLPSLINNPGAFDGGYEAIAPNGRVVAPSSVDWSSARGYALRQKPGRNNALGQVKFLFPNKHAIYLHDTPRKDLFKRSNRAYSSGCVRIQDPVDFANILLQNTNWNSDKIKRSMNQSKEVWAQPAVEIPIYLVYWTTWFEPELLPEGNVINPERGKLHFAADIYGKDKALLRQYNRALHEGYSALSFNP